jgi:acyl dehydratase
MPDKSFIGLETQSRSVDVEKGQLKFFVQATGETNPVYFDKEVARAALHPALSAPPTCRFCLETMAPSADSAMAKLGTNVGRVLLGEQQFTYGKPTCAGDTITLRTKVSDTTKRKATPSISSASPRANTSAVRL